MAKKEITEEALVQFLKTGTEEAFDILYANYASTLLGHILKIVKNRAFAEDILQECFVKIWNNLSYYDPEKGRLYTWMINIVKNTCIDILKSKQIKNSLQNQDLENSVYEIDQQYATEYNIETIGLKKIVAELPMEELQVLNKMYFEGFTQKEISENLGIPLGTVKTRARQAIQKLRTVFGKSEKGGKSWNS